LATVEETLLIFQEMGRSLGTFERPLLKLQDALLIMQDVIETPAAPAPHALPTAPVPHALPAAPVPLALPAAPTPHALLAAPAPLALSPVESASQLPAVIPPRSNIIDVDFFEIDSNYDDMNRKAQELEANMKKMLPAADQVGETINDNAKEQEKHNSKVEAIVSIYRRARDSVNQIGSAYEKVAGLGQSIGKMTLGSAMEQQQFKSELIVRTGSAEVGTAMFDKLKADAAAAGQNVNDSLQSALTLLPISRNTDDLMQLNTLAAQMAPFEKSGGGITAAASALKDAMSGDTKALASQFELPEAAIGKSRVGEAGQAGDVGAFVSSMSKLLEAQHMGEASFKTMMDSPLAKMNELRTRVAQLFTDAGNGALSAFMPIVDMLNQAFANGTFQQVFAFIQSGLVAIGNVATAVVGWLLKHWNAVADALAIVGVIAAGAAAIWLISWTIANWPLLAIIGAIALLGAVLSSFGVTADQIIGTVIGAFSVLFAQIWNAIAPIWNLLVSIAEIIFNLFYDPVYVIQKLFYDLGQTILGILFQSLRGVEDFAGGFVTLMLQAINKVLEGCNWLIDKLNKLPGFNIKSAKLLDENNVHLASDSVKSLMDNWQVPTSSKAVKDFSVAKMDYKDIQGSFDSGYGFGAGLVNKMTGAIGGADALGKWTQTPQMPIQTQTLPDINHVGSVGSINDTVDISSEDIKMLRDLAEMKNIQNFVSLTPTVQLTTGDINSGHDVDTIIAKIKTTLETDIASSAEGAWSV